VLGCVASVPFLAGCLGGGGGGGSDDEQGDGEDEGTQEVRRPDLVVGDQELEVPFPVGLVEPGTDDVLANLHWHGTEVGNWPGEWHFAPLEIPESGVRVVQARFKTRADAVLELGDDGPFELAVNRTAETPAALIETRITQDILEIRGRTLGEGAISLAVQSGGEREWLAPPLPIEVLP
jgi:hypothetical protein